MESAHASPNPHLSKCHIVGNHLLGCYVHVSLIVRLPLGNILAMGVKKVRSFYYTIVFMLVKL